jgi:hypothetical protein
LNYAFRGGNIRQKDKQLIILPEPPGPPGGRNNVIASGGDSGDGNKSLSQLLIKNENPDYRENFEAEQNRLKKAI